MTASSDFYGGIVERLLFPIWEGALARRPTLEYRALLSKTERVSLDELRALQLAKLKRLLEHAFAHVPHYRARFRQSGFEPADVRSLDDLARLPILTREEARRTVEARTSTAPPLVAFRAVTGGTLGSALAFGYDADTEWWRKAAQLRAWGWAGYPVGARALYYVGDHHGLRPQPGQRLRTALERALKREHYLSCMVRDEQSLARAARYLAHHRPKVMVCYPQAGADLARYVCEHGPKTVSDVVVLCHGEKLFFGDRLVMQQAFGPAVFETYASREVFMIASECEAHDGLHVTMENVLVEVVVREGQDARAAAPGEIGEVVLTDLNNRGMPFIRYAIGDVTSALRFEACACGRTLPRMDSIEGRVVETLRGPCGERISSTLFEQILMNVLGSTLKRFQIVQRGDGAVTLRLVPSRAFTPLLLETLLSECRAMVNGLAVTAVVVPDLPPEPGGKRRVVWVEGH